MPAYFKPDQSIYDFLGIGTNKNYAILRFVSWNASHDIGQGGFTGQEKDEIVDYLSQKYTLFISSEAEVPEKYKKYLFKIPPEKMHDAMAFADIVVSEGATMASEAGVLGVPAIYVNSLVRCYNEDQEKYGLVFNYQSGKGVLNRIKEIEKIPNLKEEFIQRRQQLLNDKIDITAFLVWFVENYPQSKETITNDKDVQYKFKAINN